MTRIFAILFGLLTLAACDTGGSYLGTSSNTYEANSDGGSRY